MLTWSCGDAAFHKAMLARKALLAEYKANIIRLKDQTTK